MTSGLAKGARGIVTGEHARLLVDFPDEVNEKLNIGDQIQIMAKGRGIALSDFPEIEFKKPARAFCRPCDCGGWQMAAFTCRSRWNCRSRSWAPAPS